MRLEAQQGEERLDDNKFTFYSQFNWVWKPYLITWKNYDEKEILFTEEVDWGSTPQFKRQIIPKKESDTLYHYSFFGWGPEIIPVKGEATYIAQFDRE
jgi:hypothetical protein